MPTTSKPDGWAVTNILIRESVRAALSRAAEVNQVSLNREIGNRLEASLEEKDRLELAALRNSMETGWYRFESRFLQLELEAPLLKALEAKDYETARSLAIALRRQKAATAQMLADRMAAGD